MSRSVTDDASRTIAQLHDRLHDGPPLPPLPVIVDFLGAFEVAHTDDAIMKSAAALRRTSIETKPKVALPDAILMATGLIRSKK